MNMKMKVSHVHMILTTTITSLGSKEIKNIQARCHMRFQGQQTLITGFKLITI